MKAWDKSCIKNNKLGIMDVRVVQEYEEVHGKILEGQVKQMKDWNESCIIYDDWLDRFSELISKCNTPIIDLGCGSGNDTKYLIERGKRVIACDCAVDKIEKLRHAIPEAEAICMDMQEEFPFQNSIAQIIIADLSLHFFDEETTFRILNEIKRVLRSNGMLLFRLNAISDYHTDKLGEVELERHFYQTERGSFRRFFDKEDINRFFAGWKLRYLEEETMYRYKNPKYLWTGAVQADIGNC